MYLIPTGLSDAAIESVVPAYNLQILSELKFFIVENIRTARRWIRKCLHDFSFEGVEFFELNRHTEPNEIAGMLAPLREGRDVGLLSEAGCPAIADPGAAVVELAHREKIQTVPLVGPSSITLALMGSGFNGQSFCFNGYLPIDDHSRISAIKRLERESRDFDRTQIFIETPYRNDKMVAALAATLNPDTLICVAANLTDPEESIIVKKASEWKKTEYHYNKIPAIFLIYANHNPRR